MSDRVLWIWLSLACGPGSRAYNKLFASFSTLREIYDAPRERLMEVDGITDRVADALADKDLTRSKDILSFCMQKNWYVLTYGDKGYPKRLKTLVDPPVVLYCKGRFLDLNDQVCIAVVGTRRMTEYGEHQAYALSYAMAAGGAIIVSGMALGCDAMAANGALDADAPTVAVLGCGLDIVYPHEHRTLSEHIAKTGMIMTEYPPGSRPEGAHFPVRNRIISGLSQGTLVVEAPEGSGSLITARTALYQGRDLFAVPGEVGSVNSAGCNALIKAGAQTVTSAYDVLSEYEFVYPHRISVEAAKYAERAINSKSGQESAARRRISARPQLSTATVDDGVISVTERTRRKAEEAAQAEAEKNDTSGSYSFANAKREREDVVREERERKKAREAKAADAETDAAQNVTAETPVQSEVPITDVEGAILAAIGNGAVTPDEICSKGFSPAEVMSSLTILEILGHVTAVPGGRYVKTKK